MHPTFSAVALRVHVGFNGCPGAHCRATREESQMTVNLNVLSESILRETEDSRYKREIAEHSTEIAEKLRETGVYESAKSGLRISVSRR